MGNYFLKYYVNQYKMVYISMNMDNLALREYYLLMHGVFNNSFFILNLKVLAFV